MPDPVIRSTTLDLFPPEGRRQEILNSIRRYRAACRELYSAMLLAQTAGATITEHDDGIRMKPSNDAAKVALAAVLGSARIERGERVRGEGQGYQVSVGSSMAYELRSYFLQHLFPTALSFVWDSARRDVTTTWTALDPEHTRAQRGWLALQGARGVAQFQRRGIGFPLASARPKLAGKTLTLKWDREMDAVTFQILDRLNPGQYWIWKQLRDKAEGWALGTIYLTERAGKLYVTISYSRPTEEMAVDPARICSVSFGEGRRFIVMTSPDGGTEWIADGSVLRYLKQQRARKEAVETARAACGSSTRSWGHRNGWRENQEVISRLTQQRERVQKDYNHSWARRIVSRAAYWKCGKIELGEFPDAVHGHPWQWAQLKEFVRYKAQEIGIKVV